MTWHKPSFIDTNVQSRSERNQPGGYAGVELDGTLSPQVSADSNGQLASGTSDGQVPVAISGHVSFRSPGIKDLRDYGTIDYTGTTACDTALAAMLAAMPALGGDCIIHGLGTIKLTQAVVVPPNVTLRLGSGLKILHDQRDGGVGFTLSASAAIVGEGKGSASTYIEVLSTAVISDLISNLTFGASLQEWAQVSGIHITVDSGATVSGWAIDFRQLFITSFIRDVTMSLGGACDGIRVTAGTTSGGGGYGPVELSTVWVLNAKTDGILLTEHNPSSGACIVFLDKVNVEHWAQSGAGHGIHINGFGGMRVICTNFQSESAVTISSGKSAAIYLDGANLELDGAVVLATPTANKYGVWITSNAQNGRYSLKNLVNPNLIQIIQDDKTGYVGELHSIDRYENNFRTVFYGAVPQGPGNTVIFGTGSPEGVVTATVGLQLYVDQANGNLYSKQSGSGNTGWKQVGAPSGIIGSATVIAATNSSWPIPSGATKLKITAVGGGAGGGGGGSSSAIAGQVGGAGGSAGVWSTQVVDVGTDTTLNVTIGAGGAGGTGGAAGGNAGLHGTAGSSTTVTSAGGTSVKGLPGGFGNGAAANSSAAVAPQAYGAATSGSTSTVASAGTGGQSGIAGGASQGYTGGAGGGGGASTATLGGGAGGAGTKIAGGAAGSAGASGTTAGVVGASAAANTGAGGGGGGGGSWNAGTGNGAGGDGGAGGSGLVIIETVG